MGFKEDVYNIIIVFLGNINFLGGGDENKAKLNLFFEKWEEEDPNYFESLKAVFAQSEVMQNLFDTKNIDFPDSQTGVLNQGGMCDNLTDEQSAELINYLNSDDFKNTLINL